jgi:hypothetical protein
MISKGFYHKWYEMESNHLHLGDIGIGRGFAAMLLSDARLVLAQVLASGTEGLFGHFEGCVGVCKGVVEGKKGILSGKVHLDGGGYNV